MWVDELMLKLGIDQSQVGPGLDSFKQKVMDAVGHGQKSFLKIGTAAASFKRAIDSISSASPLLGSALRFALNPMVALIGTAVAGFVSLKNKISETNKELDRMAESNAASKVVEILEAAAKGQPAAHAAIASQVVAEARARYIEAQRAYVKSTIENEPTEEMETVLGPEGPVKRTTGRLVDKPIVMQRLAEMRLAEATYRAAIAREKSNAEEQSKFEQDKARALNEAHNYQSRMKAQEERQKLEDEFNRDLQKVQTDMANEARKRNQSTARMAADLAGQYQPTLEELSEFRTFAGAQAREILWGRRAAKWQYAMGDVKGATETIFGRGGVRQLEDQLRAAGIIQNDAGAILRAATDGQGNLKVNIIEGAE